MTRVDLRRLYVLVRIRPKVGLKSPFWVPQEKGEEMSELDLR